MIRVTEEIFDFAFTKLTSLVVTHTKATSVVPSDRWAQMTNLKILDFSKVELSPDEQHNFIINTSNLAEMRNLEKLKIAHLSATTKETLQNLVHLKQFNISHESPSISCRGLEIKYGQQFQVLDYFQELEEVKLCRYMIADLKMQEVQEKYSHVRFRWLVTIEDEDDEREGYYEGDFSENNLMHGRGWLEFKNGDRYEGEFKNDKMEGRGVLTDLSGDRYEGEFKENESEGNGVSFYQDGSRYEGEFKNGLKEGFGKYFFAHGDRYEGEFRNGLKGGLGKYFYANGDRYEGGFKNGKRSGNGIFIKANEGEKCSVVAKPKIKVKKMKPHSDNDIWFYGIFL
jgi:hypothetical protein